MRFYFLDHLSLFILFIYEVIKFMFKLNDSSGDRYEIGSSITANQLSYASLHKYIKENDKFGNRVIRMYQLKSKTNF